MLVTIKHKAIKPVVSINSQWVDVKSEEAVFNNELWFETNL